MRNRTENTMSSWHDRLSSATTEEEVARTARDYVTEWSPAELAALPEHCRPGKIRDGQDVNDLAFKLTHLRFTPGYEPIEDGPLAAMECFFAQACQHLARINNDAPGGDPAQLSSTELLAQR